MNRRGKRTSREDDEDLVRRPKREGDTAAHPAPPLEAEVEEEEGEWLDSDDSDDDGIYDDTVPLDEEEIIIDDDDDDDEYAEFQRETAGARELREGIKSVSFATAGGAAGDEEGEEDENAALIWRHDQETEAPGELAYSNKAYDSFFQLQTEYPCLSFDILRDADGASRTRYPLSMLLVCGSQADETAKNHLNVLHITNVCRTKHDVESDADSEESYIGDEGDSEGDSDADEEAEEVNNGEPIVQHRSIRHHGTANRVRVSPHSTPVSGPQLVAVWSDAGHVQVFDLESDVRALADFANWSREQVRAAGRKSASPLRFCTPSSAHRTEGYGLGWSVVSPHVFASGDCAGDLFVWQPTEDGRWKAAASSTGAGLLSVEEIAWSPTQATVLVAARAGGSVEVWDTRDMRGSKICWAADTTDINVADWNRARQASHLLATGADSGAVAIWDLRRLGGGAPGVEPIQRLAWHRRSITSVEFSAHNESVLAVTADDGQCTLWDLSLERDPGEEKEVIGKLFGRQDLTDIPDQLMFQHQGLVHPKEAHFHSQIPGMVVTTDYQGLHLFRPMNWRSLMK